MVVDNTLVTLEQDQKKLESRVPKALYRRLVDWKKSREVRIGWPAIGEFLARMVLALPPWLQQTIGAGKSGILMEVLRHNFPETVCDAGLGQKNDKTFEPVVSTSLMKELNQWREERPVKLTNRDIVRIATRIFLSLPPESQETVAYEADPNRLKVFLGQIFPQPKSFKDAIADALQAERESDKTGRRHRRGHP
jgi:hypothetical protein